MLIEHDMRVVFNLADRISVLDRAACSPRARPTRSRPIRVQAAYLGRPNERAGSRRLNTFYGKSHILHDVA